MTTYITPQTAEQFQSRIEKAEADNIRLSSRCAKLEVMLYRMIAQFEGAAETQDDLDTLAAASRLLEGAK